MHRGKIGGPSWILAALAASTAHGDGVCEKGYRDTTSVERQTVTTVLETVRAALPPAPLGWIIGGYEEISAAGNLCRDAETTPWPYTFSRIYNRADDAEARDAALREAGAAAKVAMEQKQPRIDALMAKMQALGAELGAAAQSGDNARVDAINQEMEQLSKEFETIFNEGDSQAQLQAAAVEYGRDREINIGVAINPAVASPQSDARSLSPPAGAHAAWRWSSSGDIPMDSVLVLLGSWSPRAEGGMQSDSRAGAAPAAAHAMAITVSADAGRLDSVLDSIDFSAIAAPLRD